MLYVERASVTNIFAVRDSECFRDQMKLTILIGNSITLNVIRLIFEIDEFLCI